MGKSKYQETIKELFKSSPVVKYSSINRILNKDKLVKQYNKQLIRNLLKSKKINRITKGYYTIFDDPSLLVFCLQPAYLGLQDALSFHNIWEQETIPVIITTRKIRCGIREVFGSNVFVRRIDKKYFFGINYEKDVEFYLPYSDLEKTFLDIIYFKENLNKESLQNILIKLNKSKLQSYIKKYPKQFQKIVNNLVRLNNIT